MDYYTYEFIILLELYEAFKIEQICVNADSRDYVKMIRNTCGNLENKVVLRTTNSETIHLKFKLNYFYEFERRLLHEAFEQKCPYDVMAEILKDKVQKNFLEEFLLRGEDICVNSKK